VAEAMAAGRLMTEPIDVAAIAQMQLYQTKRKGADTLPPRCDGSDRAEAPALFGSCAGRQCADAGREGEPA
jgi:hypothetical protein